MHVRNGASVHSLYGSTCHPRLSVKRDATVNPPLRQPASVSLMDFFFHKKRCILRMESSLFLDVRKIGKAVK